MEDFELKVKVGVEEAEKSLEKISQKAQEAKREVENLNDTTKDSVPAVGSLDKAWESAFDNITEGLGSTGTSIRKIVSGVKGAIPVVKNLNNTAITGLKGIKAAIASTGLGVVVLILGEVLAHWQDIAKWIGIGTERQESYTRAVERTEAAMDRLNFQHEKEIRLLKAAGASNEEIASTKVKQAEEDRRQLDLLYQQNMAHAQSRKERKQLTEEYEKQAKAASDNVVAAKRELEIVKEEERIRKEREASEKKSGGGSTRASSLKDTATESKSVVDSIKKDAKDVTEVMTAVANNLENAFPEASVNYFKKLLDSESVRDSTEEVIEELQKADIEINNALISGLLVGDAQSSQNKINELISERQLMFSRGFRTLSEDLKAEWEVQTQTFNEEEALLLKRIAYVEKYVKEGTELEDLKSQLVVLSDNRITEAREYERKIAEAILEEENELLERQSAGFSQDVSFDLAGFRENYRQRQEALQTYYAAMRDSYDEGTVMYEKYAEEYERITEKLNNIDKERVQAEFQYLEQQYEYWNKLAGGIADILGSVADIREEDIRQRLKEGEINEDQAEKEFKRVKGFQIAQVWVNTLSGAIGSFMQASATYPPPAGQIIGATLAAAAIASGIAQTQKIKNTTLNGSTSGGGISAPSVGVTPLEVTDDIQASPTALAESQTAANQRVYILESDIQDSNRRVEIRESNSTF